MSKADKLTRLAGANMASSITTRRGAGGPTPAPAADPKYQGVVKAKDVAVIEVGRVLRDESQPRQEFDRDGLARLAESLKARGQLQPVRVRWDAGQGAYVLIAGERRWRAAQLAGLPTLTAVIHDGEPGPEDVLAMQLVENALREDLRPIEQAQAYRRLMDQFGWTTTRLGKELSVSQPSIVQSLKLLELPEGVQERVEQGDLSPTAAYEISKLDDPEEQAALAEQVVAGGLRRDDLRSRVREKKGGGQTKAVFRRGPFVVTVQGPVEDQDAVRETLMAVADQLGVRKAG